EVPRERAVRAESPAFGQGSASTPPARAGVNAAEDARRHPGILGGGQPPETRRARGGDGASGAFGEPAEAAGGAGEQGALLGLAQGDGLQAALLGLLLPPEGVPAALGGLGAQLLQFGLEGGDLPLCPLGLLRPRLGRGL